MKIQAESINALVDMLGDDWYNAVEGDYGTVPTWGPETESVLNQIGRSCADGDIVSWDTRDADPASHIYLRRRWTPDCPDGNEQSFYLAMESDL